jgi:hypothetical protein
MARSAAHARATSHPCTATSSAPAVVTIAVVSASSPNATSLRGAGGVHAPTSRVARSRSTATGSTAAAA